MLVIRAKPGSNNIPPGAIAFAVQHNNTTPPFPTYQTVAFVGSLSSAFPTLVPQSDSSPLGQTSTTANNTNNAVFYQPPNNFFFGCNSSSQALTLSASYGGTQVATATVNLIRPTTNRKSRPYVVPDGHAANPDRPHTSRRSAQGHSA